MAVSPVTVMAALSAGAGSSSFPLTLMSLGQFRRRFFRVPVRQLLLNGGGPVLVRRGHLGHRLPLRHGNGNGAGQDPVDGQVSDVGQGGPDILGNAHLVQAV